MGLVVPPALAIAAFGALLDSPAAGLHHGVRLSLLLAAAVGLAAGVIAVPALRNRTRSAQPGS